MEAAGNCSTAKQESGDELAPSLSARVPRSSQQLAATSSPAFKTTKCQMPYVQSLGSLGSISARADPCGSSKEAAGQDLAVHLTPLSLGRRVLATKFALLLVRVNQGFRENLNHKAAAKLRVGIPDGQGSQEVLADMKLGNEYQSQQVSIWPA